MSWREWYLPRYGITVYGQQVFRDGETPHAFTATDGVTRYRDLCAVLRPSGRG